MAAHDVPPAVQKLLEFLVGNDFPEGNEGDLRAMATAWRDLGNHLQAIIGDAGAAAASVGRGISGPVLDEFHTFVDPIIAPDGYLAGSVTICFGLADALEAMALEVETLRILIIEALIFLAAQIAADIAAAPFTFGGSTALIEAHEVAVRAAIVTMIRKAIVKLAAHLAESVANQTVTTFIAQLIEWLQKRRHSFDAGQIALAAKNGAIGGAVGFGMGNLGGLAKMGAGKLSRGGIIAPAALANIPGPVRTVGSGGAKTTFDVGWGAASGASEAAAQDAAAGGSGDEVFGAENGALSGGRDRLHSVLNPHDKYSVSAATAIEKGINSAFDKPRTVPPRTPVQANPPVLQHLPPPTDWGDWSADVQRTVDQHLELETT
jgi:hypothetical protein